jgi:hypothetical protein
VYEREMKDIETLIPLRHSGQDPHGQPHRERGLCSPQSLLRMTNEATEHFDTFVILLFVACGAVFARPTAFVS